MCIESKKQHQKKSKPDVIRTILRGYLHNVSSQRCIYLTLEEEEYILGMVRHILFTYRTPADIRILPA